MKWLNKGTRQSKLVATKVFMLRQIFQRTTKAKLRKYVVTFSKACRDIKFRSQRSKAIKNVAIEKFYVITIITQC